MSFAYPDRVFIVAELSANHGGSLDVCLETVRAAAAAGADAIKVQTYTADTITLDSDAACFRINDGTLWDGTTLHALYSEAALPWEWHAPIQAEAHRNGLVFFSSPFDFTAVDFLAAMDVPIYKIASFEIVDIPLIEYAAARSRPMIISTGIAGLAEIEEAVAACRRVGNDDITLLTCTSAYPADPADANLLTLPRMAERFGTRIGLSDHTTSDAVAIVAVALGARVVEKHFILDRAQGGPDASFSLTPDEFAGLVRSLRVAEAALGTVQFDPTGQAAVNRRFGRSLFIAEDVKAGDILTPQNLRSVRPGDGLHPRYYHELLGRKVVRDAARGTPMDWGLLEGQAVKSPPDR
ncbi:pseudaminic acid synthase [uncultured Brevundimonas sp.]|uniref:pseudaminic acid synthase n=1 Tax=uncultured Brevundimonas sp. TaxID=213418 RepID=UPI0030EB814C|tara:strand:+ start:36990 stop:38045 length:1056 start_codon:yes stop_codon:yes gene_type:complete